MHPCTCAPRPVCCWRDLYKSRIFCTVVVISALVLFELKLQTPPPNAMQSCLLTAAAGISRNGRLPTAIRPKSRRQPAVPLRCCEARLLMCETGRGAEGGARHWDRSEYRSCRPASGRLAFAVTGRGEAVCFSSQTRAHRGIEHGNRPVEMLVLRPLDDIGFPFFTISTTHRTNQKD